MREKIAIKNQEENLVDYPEQMLHQQHQGYVLKLIKKAYKISKVEAIESYLFLPKNNHLISPYLVNYKRILIIQNRTLSSFPFLPIRLITKIKQVISQISLPTTVLLVPLGCGNREDPDDMVPGEFDFLRAGGLYYNNENKICYQHHFEYLF